MCGITWAGTNDWLSFTFCNGQKCCSTDEIQLANGREDTANEKPVDCTIPDVFGNTMIGSCKDFDFGSDSMVTSNVSASSQFANHWNAWRGEWIKVVLDSISFLECPIDGWIGGSDPSKPTFQTSSCSYQSKYNMGMGCVCFPSHAFLPEPECHLCTGSCYENVPTGSAISTFGSFHLWSVL